MAEVDSAKTLTLAEQYSLPPNEENPAQDEKPVESTEDEKPATASDDVVVEEKAEEKTDETPLSGETPASDENPVSEGAPPAEESPVSEENSDTIEQQDSSDQDASEDSEDVPEIKLETAPADVRFPTTNQTRHCFTRYIEYHRCIAARGEGAPECDRFAKYYRSLCPGEWVDRWNEQRENGTFPGPL